MNNQHQVAQVIYDEVNQTWERGEILTTAGEAERLANALADAGLLTPDTDDITRLTIVNNKGRALEEWEINNLRLETQDDGRTLKIFYTKKQA